VFDDSFPGPALDESVWTPSYLPAWSSRAEAAASYDSGAEAPAELVVRRVTGP
jgi:hypothetical protein